MDLASSDSDKVSSVVSNSDNENPVASNSEKVNPLSGGFSTVNSNENLDNVDDRGDKEFEEFVSLMNHCGSRQDFAQIFTETKDSFSFQARYIDFRFRSNRSGLTNCAKPDTWNLIPNLSQDGTYLLLPPENLASTDISDFCRRYKDRPDWVDICKTLFKSMKTSLNSLKEENPESTYWVYTHGLAEPYLHIRFEPFNRRKYG